MTTLYHGSNVSIEQIDLSLSRKGKDFGCGFYLNANRLQALDMAVRTTQRMKSGEPIVSAFLFEESILLSDTDLSTKIFDDYSVEWAEFVLMNRKNTSDTPAHSYDIVSALLPTTLWVYRYADSSWAISAWKNSSKS